MSKIIRIVGDITESEFDSFDSDLSYHEEQNPNGCEIDLRITSQGGLEDVGLAIYDRIKASPLHIVTTVHGMAYSSASLVLSAGNHRRMMPNAWIMYHQSTFKSKDMTSAAAHKIEHHKRCEEQWVKLIQANSRLTIEQLHEMHMKETYINAEEALKYGLIEEIVNG